MSVTNHGDKVVLTAAADYTTKKYYLVKQTSDLVATLCTAITDKVLGAIANKPKAGESVEIAGVSRGSTFLVKLGGTVSVGDELSSATDGRAIVATGSGTRVFGIAMQDGVANDVIEVRSSERLIP